MSDHEKHEDRNLMRGWPLVVVAPSRAQGQNVQELKDGAQPEFRPLTLVERNPNSEVLRVLTSLAASRSQIFKAPDWLPAQTSSSV